MYVRTRGERAERWANHYPLTDTSSSSSAKATGTMPTNLFPPHRRCFYMMGHSHLIIKFWRGQTRVPKKKTRHAGHRAVVPIWWTLPYCHQILERYGQNATNSPRGSPVYPYPRVNTTPCCACKPFTPDAEKQKTSTVLQPVR